MTLLSILAAAVVGALVGRAVWGLGDGGVGLGMDICGVWLRIGWGYDDDLPLRPWPAARRNDRGRFGVYYCVAWFGFYAGALWPAVAP